MSQPLDPSVFYTHVYIATTNEQVLKRLKVEGFTPVQALDNRTALPVQYLYGRDLRGMAPAKWPLFMASALPTFVEGCLCERCQCQYQIGFDLKFFHATSYVL